MSSQICLKVTRPVIQFLAQRTLRFDNCRRRKSSPRKCGKFVTSKFKILTCVVFTRTGVLLLSAIINIVSALSLPCYYQSCHQLWRIICNIFPEKEQRKPIKVKNKFTYSHANTPVGQSEHAYYPVSYFTVDLPVYSFSFY